LTYVVRDTDKEEFDDEIDIDCIMGEGEYEIEL